MTLLVVEEAENIVEEIRLDSLRGSYTRHFNYTDALAPTGISYYRIRCTDLAGKASVTSKIISTTVINPVGGKIYPSRFSNHFFIALPAGESVQKITVYDINWTRIPVR